MVAILNFQINGNVYVPPYKSHWPPLCYPLQNNLTPPLCGGCRFKLLTVLVFQDMFVDKLVEQIAHVT